MRRIAALLALLCPLLLAPATAGAQVPVTSENALVCLLPQGQ